MRAPPPARRVILVVPDGSRPDAAEAFDLRHLRALTAPGAYTPRARTVSWSVRAAIRVNDHADEHPAGWSGRAPRHLVIPADAA